jgi:hypothetical protein
MADEREAWREGYDAAVQMVRVAAGMKAVRGPAGRVLDGMATTLDRVRDEVEAKAFESGRRT